MSIETFFMHLRNAIFQNIKKLEKKIFKIFTFTKEYHNFDLNIENDEDLMI